MKILFFLAAYLLFVSDAFSQTPFATFNKDYYLTKSRHQKTLAWVLLGGGVALTAIGVGIETSNVTTGSTNDHGANVIAIIGVASGLGSIPLFISAAHNKKRAMALTFDIDKIPTMNTVKISNKQLQPTATLHIRL